MARPFSKPMSMPMVMAVFAVAGMVVSTLSPAEAFSSTVSTNAPPRTPTFIPSTRSTTTLFVSQSNKGNDKETMQEGGKESEEDFQRRMAIVRSLQMSFYGKDAAKKETMARGNQEIEIQNGSDRETENAKDSSEASTSHYGPPQLEASTGTISKLPLFRAAWHELPGRSNILILRDPQYTNMFERMFYTRKNNVAGSSSAAAANSNMTPWVFGHLYTPKGYENESGKAQEYELLAWNDTNPNADTTVSPLSSQAVLGTLMYVRDYRRLKDGRILALVQAAEKFVVEEVCQSLPYAIADVRILPDVEELGLGEALRSGVDDPSHTETTGNDDDSDGVLSSSAPISVYSCEENNKDERFLVNCLRSDEGTSAGPARARAIFESIHSYHQYECDSQQRLDGIPQKSDLSILDITHAAISKALPYCRFSNTTETLAISNEIRTELPSPPSSTTSSPSLEFQLLRRGITKIPPSDLRFSYNTEPTYSSASSDGGIQKVGSSRPWTTEELEYELWLVLDNFSATTGKTLSPILLALLPREDQMPKAWPSGFRLKDMLEEHHQDNPPSVANKSSVYPNHRRQRRFSYSAAYLLEAILPINEGSGSSSDPAGVYSDNFRNGGRRCAPKSSDNTGTFEVDEIQEFRALLLSVPSTRQRLRVVLETYHRWRLYQECDEFA